MKGVQAYEQPHHRPEPGTGGDRLKIAPLRVYNRFAQASAAMMGRGVQATSNNRPTPSLPSLSCHFSTTVSLGIRSMSNNDFRNCPAPALGPLGSHTPAGWRKSRSAWCEATLCRVPLQRHAPAGNKTSGFHGVKLELVLVVIFFGCPKVHLPDMESQADSQESQV